MLTCAHFFTDDAPDEAAIRTVADAMYRRVEWDKALDQAATLYMGWRPETGFLAPRWSGYNEALLLYILALGSPTQRPALVADARMSVYRAGAETRRNSRPNVSTVSSCVTGAFSNSGLPFPVSDFLQVFAMGVDIVGVLDQLVAHLLLEVRALGA
jgi:hypothetical protein